MTKELSPLRQKDIRQGEKQERERIIAILERDADEWYRLGNKHTGDAIKLAIWLIKGENDA